MRNEEVEWKQITWSQEALSFLFYPAGFKFCSWLSVIIFK